MKGLPPNLKRIPFLLGMTPILGDSLKELHNREKEKIICNT